MMVALAIALAASGVFLALLPRMLDEEREALDDRARGRGPGRFLALSQGQVHCEVRGPEGGAPVVLLPGVSLPMFVWDHAIEPLAQAGFRVVRYDLYGRGYSDRPEVVYRPELFDRQLEEVLSALDLRGPVHLVGIALGGLLAVRRAARAPASVRSLSLIAPDGFGTAAPTLVKVARMPVIGSALGLYLARVLGDRELRSRLGRYTEVPGLRGELEGKLGEALRYRGYKRALVSSLRHQAPNGEAAAAYRAAAAAGIPALVLWGERDQIASPELAQRAVAALPGAELLMVGGAGHLPMYDRPKVVAPALIRHFSAAERAAR